MAGSFNRRSAFQLGAVGLAVGAMAGRIVAGEVNTEDDTPPRTFLTPGKDFADVSRGDPIPHKLTGEALVKARLTPETWRLEIVAEDKATIEKPLTLDAGTAIDLPTLMKLGETHSVKFLKAMQCNNIAAPLGQGLWEGVPLREVLKLCGKIVNPRRVYYWGFHNDKPEQMFKSSLAMGQVLDTPPGEMPPFIAYRLNGEPIPLTRGGPVRMVVPWAHGFKSIKWLQKMVLTYKHEANDTYAEVNNDPESYLKTAAYFDSTEPQDFAANKPIVVRGTSMVGWPGLERIEYWLRPASTDAPLAEDDPAWKSAEWKSCTIDAPPSDWGGGLPDGVLPKSVWGFDDSGKPKEWPMRFSIAHWTLILKDIAPGKYELRLRTVDKNGFAQPEPRPSQRSGRNLVQMKPISIAAK